MESSLLEQVMSTNNEIRNQAEAAMEQERASNPANLVGILVNGMQKDNSEVA